MLSTPGNTSDLENCTAGPTNLLRSQRFIEDLTIFTFQSLLKVGPSQGTIRKPLKSVPYFLLEAGVKYFVYHLTIKLPLLGGEGAYGTMITSSTLEQKSWI